VLKALEEASQGDKIKTNICGFAQLGLVELTRKKTRLSLADSMQLPCPYCDGDGKILNEVSIIENVLEELKRISNAQPQAYAVLRLNPYILTALKKYPEVVKKFEGLKIYVREDNSMHVEDFNISMTDKLSDLDGLIRI